MQPSVAIAPCRTSWTCRKCRPGTSSVDRPRIQSIKICNVLGANWDPTDKKFSSVNSFRQNLLPTCKAFPKETTTCIWSIQITKSATVQQCCRRAKCSDLIWVYAGQPKTKCCSSSTQSNDLHALDTACPFYLGEHCLPSGLCLPADHGIQS